MELEKLLKEAREAMDHNEKVIEAYNKQINEANKYYNENLKQVEADIYRMLGICDWYRKKHPNTSKSDSEIIQQVEGMLDRYNED